MDISAPPPPPPPPPPYEEPPAGAISLDDAVAWEVERNRRAGETLDPESVRLVFGQWVEAGFRLVKDPEGFIGTERTEGSGPWGAPVDTPPETPPPADDWMGDPVDKTEDSVDKMEPKPEPPANPMARAMRDGLDDVQFVGPGSIVVVPGGSDAVEMLVAQGVEKRYAIYAVTSMLTGDREHAERASELSTPEFFAYSMMNSKLKDLMRVAVEQSSVMLLMDMFSTLRHIGNRTGKIPEGEKLKLRYSMELVKIFGVGYLGEKAADKKKALAESFTAAVKSIGSADKQSSESSADDFLRRLSTPEGSE